MPVAGQPVEEHTFDSAVPGLHETGAALLWIESHPVVRVRLDELRLEGSPRSGGEDMEHVRLLADVEGSLPPITVHLPSMRVIDGAHRVRAARLNGGEEIDARLLECPDDAAFVLAVRANVSYGLPLSRADRAAAAGRIIACHPEWSDRAVAAATGLSDKTVCRIRSRSTAEGPQSDTRLGRDGRTRPLDSGLRRLRAAAMFRERPTAGLREVARATGLSTATVYDVRRRLSRGEDPVPGRYRAATAGSDTSPCTAGLTAEAAGGAATPAAALGAGTRKPGVDRRRVLAGLCDDPSVRMTEDGRLLLRWLHHYALDPMPAADLDALCRGLPPHWAAEVADLARSCAVAWARLADRLQP